MQRKLVTWLFFIAVCLVAPTCHSAFTWKGAPLKQQNQLKNGHGTITDSSRIGYRATHGTENDEFHGVKILGKAKGVYGGANDLRRPHPARNGSGSSLVKTNSFLSVVLRLVAVLLLICALLP
ncbi:hypothetical protein FNV43_RR03372 [Rhamnella rubrinervis]|uniref:Uncharacterized protein n=1 Tax=Rhamnella rubrinervis TaxID=2594499 RepID=A0A8K0HJR7_9ROSA|nr:hypothetical protein FNV43_RR03372 [Rhamnella rubrinervis]